MRHSLTYVSCSACWRRISASAAIKQSTYKYFDVSDCCQVIDWYQISLHLFVQLCRAVEVGVARVFCVACSGADLCDAVAAGCSRVCVVSCIPYACIK